MPILSVLRRWTPQPRHAGGRLGSKHTSYTQRCVCQDSFTPLSDGIIVALLFASFVCVSCFLRPALASPLTPLSLSLTRVCVRRVLLSRPLMMWSGPPRPLDSFPRKKLILAQSALRCVFTDGSKEEGIEGTERTESPTETRRGRARDHAPSSSRRREGGRAPTPSPLPSRHCARRTRSCARKGTGLARRSRG